MTADEIIQAAIDRLARELKNCRTLLQSYGDQHISKDPPQSIKAQANYRQVSEINAALVHVGELLALHRKAEEDAKVKSSGVTQGLFDEAATHLHDQDLGKQRGQVGFTTPTPSDPLGQGL